MSRDGIIQSDHTKFNTLSLSISLSHTHAHTMVHITLRNPLDSIHFLFSMNHICVIRSSDALQHGELENNKIHFSLQLLLCYNKLRIARAWVTKSVGRSRSRACGRGGAGSKIKLFIASMLVHYFFLVFSCVHKMDYCDWYALGITHMQWHITSMILSCSTACNASDSHQILRGSCPS